MSSEIFPSPTEGIFQYIHLRLLRDQASINTFTWTMLEISPVPKDDTIIIPSRLYGRTEGGYFFVKQAPLEEGYFFVSRVSSGIPLRVNYA